MELIKAVRVRPENTLYYERLGGIGDYKIMLFKETKKKYKVSFFPVRGAEPTGVVTTTEYKKSGIYENLTDDEFINAGLDTLSKLNKKRYEIIQDPWQNQSPIKRIYGTDPYFLNNGAKVLIKWFIGDRFNNDRNGWQAIRPSIQETGIIDVWSDDNGQELDVIPYQSYSDIRSMQNGLFKTVEIYAPIDELPPFKYEGDDDALLIDYATNLYVKKPSNDPLNLTVNELTFSGKMYDSDILKSVIERWKLEVPNYDLKLCAKQYQPCFVIEYKSPLVKQDLPDAKEDNTPPPPPPDKIKEKITIILPTDLKLKVKQDLPSLKVYVGEVPATATASQSLDGFDLGEEDDLSLLGDEFIEESFGGLSEEDIKLEEQKGDNIGEEIQYDSGSVVDVKSEVESSGKDKLTWNKNGTVVMGAKVPNDVAKSPSYTQRVTINDTIKTYYIPEINKIKASYGTKLLAIVMAQKEGFTKNSRSFRTNNPGNIGNTDSGANKTLKTLKDGIQLQIDYINKVASGQHSSYPIGKRKKIPPYYSPEIANNPGYGLTPFLPGYDFIYSGKIEEYVKIYATGARAGNSYISMIVSWFRKNGYNWVTEETTISELIKIEKNPRQTAAVIV